MNSYLDHFRININNARKMAKDLERLLLLGDSKISNNINRVSDGGSHVHVLCCGRAWIESLEA